MWLQLKRMIGVLALAAAAAMLVAAVGASAAGASEFKSAEGFPVEALGEGLGLSTFLSSELNSVVCHKSHSKGSVESATLAKVSVTYLTNCELVVEKSAIGKFKESCPTIFTKELDVKPISKLNGGTKTGLLFLPAVGTELASFTCTGSNKTEVKLKGSVLCESTAIGSAVTERKVTCKANSSKHGEQEFTTGTDPSGKSVTAGLTSESTLSIFKITEKDSQETTEDVKYCAALEQTA